MSDNSELKKSKEQRLKQSKHGHHGNNQSEIDCQTPPLSEAVAHSIEELIKQRKILKEKLSKISRKIEENSRKRKHSSNSSILKKQQELNKKLCKISVVKQDDDFDIDSENEDKIIDYRREQRRLLMEKFIPTPEHVTENESIHLKLVQKNISLEPINVSNAKHDIAQDIPDMFSESDIFKKSPFASTVAMTTKSNFDVADSWDDNDGYYKVISGDVINGKYVLSTILGQGVFANVVRAKCMHSNNPIAIKIARQDDLIYQTSLKEVKFLKQIRDADPTSKYHCIKLVENFRHRGHLCIVLELFHMNLRSALKKNGKIQGLCLKAVRSYSMQLLIALRFLKRLGIIHCDIKPDNILLNEKKNLIKLCDFGSATEVENNEATPYLVSRYYRAPEIILGFPYGHGVDIWSTACTIYEMATGKILFTGSSNNRMLKAMIDTKGKFPNALVSRGKFKHLHFNLCNNFLLHKIHETTGKEKYIEITKEKPVKDFLHKLKSCAGDSSKNNKKVHQLKDLLDKMTMVDPKLRYTATDAYAHPFIQERS